MATAVPTVALQGSARDRAFHQLRISRVVRETADARSFVLEVPAELSPAYRYEAGQFCTFRVTVGEEQLLRCYSMSSSPAVDAELQVTVKRVPGGAVSNWMNDTLAPGNVIDVSRPSGVFCLRETEGDVVAFAAGSGITPIFSILKTALATTSRHVHLLYANRDRDAVIFATELDALVERYRSRFTLTHHLDAEQGFVDRDDVRSLVRAVTDADFFICGPGPFMDLVEQTLLDDGHERERIRIERFTPKEPDIDEAADPGLESASVTIELDRHRVAGEYRPGSTILQTARQLGLSPPSSCESGNCATCMAKVVEGGATMRVNDALTPDEVADGWVLTCQAVPTTAKLHVIYGYEGT